MNHTHSISTLPQALLRRAAVVLIALTGTAPAEMVDIGPLDESLTHPVNPVARNFGVWDPDPTFPANTNEFEALEFRKDSSKYKGFDYHECVLIKYFHVQHVARLPNKNGHAYLAATNSNAWVSNWPFVESEPDGNLCIYRADSLDPETDRIRNLPTTDGELIWESRFGLDNPLGGWNHPCMMQVIGNLLVVCMQNWDGNDGCRDGYQSGVADALLFYDVRDPEHPVYWGRMTQAELGVSEVSEVGLFKAGDEWILIVGSKWWRTTSVSPNLAWWTFGGSNNNPPGLGSSHGNFFTSRESYDPPSSAPPGTTSPGTERTMFFDGFGSDGIFSFRERLEFSSVKFTHAAPYFTPGFEEPELGPKQLRAAPHLFGFGTNDYDSCGIFVTGGVPIIYSGLQDYGSDMIYQIWNRGNVRATPSLAEAVDNTALAWTTGGTKPWFGESVTDLPGAEDSARSGVIGSSQSTYLETTVTGPGRLTFDWKVSSEPSADFLRFAVDGIEAPGAPAISGEVDWRQVVVRIPAGVHTLRWTYAKNGSDAVPFAGDAAHVDRVTFTPSPPEIYVAEPADYLTGGEPNPGSLRRALADIQSGGVIRFDQTTFERADKRTITLSAAQGPLAVTKSVTIDASGFSNGITITARDACRVFEIAAGCTVEIRGLTIIRGMAGAAANLGAFGGGIHNRGTLLLTNVTVADCGADIGGGGIYNVGPALTVNNATLSGNFTLSGGAVPERGGGILNWAGTVALGNCTLAGNSAAWGGGIATYSGGTVRLDHVTISGNTAVNSGGGIHASGDTLILDNTLVAGNTAPNNPEIYGYGTISGDANITNGDPGLAALGDYGGPTQTMRLLPGSPAIDAGSGPQPATDQRGFSRVRDGDDAAGAAPDIGAYEAQAAPFSVGLNLVGRAGTLAPADTAGAPGFAQTGWNNLTTDYDGSSGGNHPNGPAPLLAAGGAALSPDLRLWWDAPSVWGKDPTALITSDQKLMGGYLDSDGSGNGATATNLYSTTQAQPFLALADLPAAATLGGYKVIVYIDGDATDGRIGKYWLTSNHDANPGSAGGEVPLTPDNYCRDASNFAGTYTRDLATAASGTGSFGAPGNYIIFEALTEPGFVIRAEEVAATGAPATGGAARAPINAVQVVRNEIVIVTTPRDELDPYGTPGTGLSLREALRDAPPGAGILFDPDFFDGSSAATITLTLGELIIRQDVTIDADNLVSRVIINGSGAPHSVLTCGSSVRVALAGLTLIGSPGLSPGIYAGPQLALANVAISGCGGGGIEVGYGAGSILIVDSCTLSGNKGSAIWMSGFLDLDEFGSLTVRNSTVSGNIGNNGSYYLLRAGGINCDTCNLKVVNSTVAGNAGDIGGGLLAQRSNAVLENVTIAGNNASSAAQNVAGGISYQPWTYTLNGVEVANTTMSMNNVIVAGNTAPATANLSGAFTGAGNLIDGDPLLAPLGRYGGGTGTMLPLPGSPAIDAGGASGLTTDQRALPRTVGSAPDIGAVESGNFVSGANRVTANADGIDGIFTEGVSLREAIALSPPGSTITFGEFLSHRTIILGGSQLLIDKDLVIDGTSLDSGVFIDANGAVSNHRVFAIVAGTTVTMKRLTISGGKEAYGGGIANSGTLALSGVTLADNLATYIGGAIYNLFGDLTLTDSTLSGNTGADFGGGILNFGGTVSLRNATLTGNAAPVGGGIYTYAGGTVTLSHATLSGNSADNGGGIYENDGTMTLNNVVVAGNTAASNANVYGAFGGGSNLTGGDPRLAPLGNYGGPTQTMLPLPGSPAIEGGALTGPSPATDQRGAARPSGPRPDIGAVEAAPFSTLTLIDADADGVPDILEGPGGPYPQFTVGVDDSALDSDGDGMPDFRELADMTDPYDPNDKLRLLSFAKAAGFDALTFPVFVVTAATFPGLDYEFESSATLQDFQLIPGSHFTADDFTAAFEIPLPPGQGFLRIRRN